MVKSSQKCLVVFYESLIKHTACTYSWTSGRNLRFPVMTFETRSHPRAKSKPKAGQKYVVGRYASDMDREIGGAAMQSSSRWQPHWIGCMRDCYWEDIVIGVGGATIVADQLSQPDPRPSVHDFRCRVPMIPSICDLESNKLTLPFSKGYSLGRQLVPNVL